MEDKAFVPIRLLPPPEKREDRSNTVITISSTLKGTVADEFESMAEEFGLKKSVLMRQMIYHCLGRTDELKDLYKRLAILGK